jgi:hypothetical protein
MVLNYAKGELHLCLMVPNMRDHTQVRATHTDLCRADFTKNVAKAQIPVRLNTAILKELIGC